MKKSILYLFTSTAILIFSCKKEEVEKSKQASLNVPFTSQINERVYLNDFDNSLALEIKSITDNRCPNHHSCNDIGVCAVRVRLTNLDNSTANTVLYINNSEEGATDDLTLTLDHKSYNIHLSNVNPKPSIADSTLPKEAEFIISAIEEE